MKHWILMGLLAICVLATQGRASAAQPKKFDALLAACPDIDSGQYAVKPYLAAAAHLQSLPPKTALAMLRKQAATGKHEQQLIILTRMLFQAKTALRRPMLGAPSFVAGTDEKAWPDEPIAIVASVPFLVVTGYALGGEAETASAYLEFSVANGTWRSQRYKISSATQLSDALTAMLASQAWPQPDAARAVFTAQIQ
jgi:hypothetical protein